MKNFLAAILKIILFYGKSPKNILPTIRKIYWRIQFIGLKGILFFYLDKLRLLTPRNQSFETQYKNWIQNQEHANFVNFETIQNFVSNLDNPPNFSIVVSAFDVPNFYFIKCIDSIFVQSYPHWELLILISNQDINKNHSIIKEYEAMNKRVKALYFDDNFTRALALNSAIQNSKHEFVCFVAGSDIISQNALYEFASLILEKKDADIIYSDEDKLDRKDRRSEPFFKPAWSPELLLSKMYTGYLTFYRKEILERIGMYRSELDGAENYDLMLRSSEIAKRIYHIPKILYHKRIRPKTSLDKTELLLKNQRKILEETLERRGLTGSVLETPPNFENWRVKIDVKNSPLVSIIIPTAAKSGYVRGKQIHYLLNCINSIIERSSYKNIEIVVLHNGDLSPEVELQLASMSQVVLVHYDKKEFNLSEKMNLGVEFARGEYVIIFNDDIEVKSSDWIESLLGFAQLDGVGAVGAKLLFEDETIQHIGVVWTYGGPSHASYKGRADSDIGHGLINILNHNRLCTTGACMMIKKSIFIKLNGWDLDFPLNYNDVDFCLRLIQSGYRNIVCPDSVLYHYESASKEGTHTLELLLLLTKWGNVIDPFYNPNFFPANPFYTLHWEDSKILKKNYEFWFLREIGARKDSYPVLNNSIIFSIITPVYNTDKKYLEELAKTIFNQTYQNFEWIILDNNSTRKETLDVLKKISQHRKVKYIRADKNYGIMGGTRLAFEEASGDYVLPIDHDDTISFDALQIILHFIVKNDYPFLLYSDEDKTNTNSRISNPFFKPDFDPVMFFNNCYIAHLCAINRKKGNELEIYTDEQSHGCPDWDTLYRFIRKGIIPYHIPEILYSWRIHPESTASGLPSIKPYTVASQYHVLKKQVEFLDKFKDYDIVTNKLLMDTGMWSIKRKNDFTNKIAISFEYNGKNLKSLVGLFELLEERKMTEVCDIFINLNTKKFSDSEMLSRLYSRGKIIFENFFETSQYLSKYEIAFYISDKIKFTDVNSFKEAMSMFSFFEDCVMVSGRIVVNKFYLFADSYFDRDGNTINSSFGSLTNSGGYYASRVVQKTVDVVSPDFWAVKLDYLNAVYNTEKINVESSKLGLVLSILAKNQNKRIIYSPYIELELLYTKGDSHYSALMKNTTNYNIINFNNQYLRIPESLELEF